MILKNMLKNGMIVKYRNGDNEFYSNGVFLDNSFVVCRHVDNYTDDLKAVYDTTGNMDIVKIYNPDGVELKLVWERPKEILDKVEKEYLSAVIKPFRNRVKYIEKRKYYYGEFIAMFIERDGSTGFPNFKPGTMYKGMELNKEYTLDELRL